MYQSMGSDIVFYVYVFLVFFSVVGCLLSHRIPKSNNNNNNSENMVRYMCSIFWLSLFTTTYASGAQWPFTLPIYFFSLHLLTPSLNTSETEPNTNAFECCSMFDFVAVKSIRLLFLLYFYFQLPQNSWNFFCCRSSSYAIHTSIKYYITFYLLANGNRWKPLFKM